MNTEDIIIEKADLLWACQDKIFGNFKTKLNDEAITPVTP